MADTPEAWQLKLATDTLRNIADGTDGRDYVSAMVLRRWATHCLFAMKNIKSPQGGESESASKNV